MATPTTTQAKTGPEAVATLLKPLLDEAVKTINNNNTVQNQEILQKLDTIIAQNAVMQNLFSEKKKNVNRKATEAAPEPSADGTTTTVTATPDKKTNLPANKMFYFREKYKTDEAFRARYLTDELRDKMTKDDAFVALIAGKKDPAQKLQQESIWMWASIKNKPEVIDEVDKEFAALKKAHAEAAKPPQQNTESATPENK